MSRAISLLSGLHAVVCQGQNMPFFHRLRGIKNPPDVTTLALGEEDGGIKNPPDVTTLALGEEDGGLTKAVGEEGNHQVPQIAVCPK